MKKVLLIAPLSEQYSGIRNYGVPSIGVHRLASFLNANGHYAEVYDCNLDDNIDKYLYKEKWDFFGISILNNTLLLSIKLIIKLEKLFSNIPVVCGNAESTVNFETILQNTFVSYIITGEGELPMLDLCNEVPVEKIKGIIYRKHGEPITDNLLWSYYEHIDFRKMRWDEYFNLNLKINPKSTEKIIRLVTSSHCRRNCTFCSLTGLHKFSCGKSVKPAYLSGDQIKILIQKAIDQIPGIETIYFCEDSILPVAERIDDFCSALKSFPQLRYMVQTETDKVSFNIIKKLSEANVFHISFGVENCSPKIRRCMGKPQDEQKIDNIISWCSQLNVRCYYLIILFSPEVTIEDLIINYNILTKWQNDKRVIVSVEPFMYSYKMSRVYNQLHDFQWQVDILPNGKKVKYPTYILPDDMNAREIMLEMQKELPQYIKDCVKKEGHIHESKDITGKYLIEYLGLKLKQKNYI